nr:Chain B, Helicon Polypeptide FP05874 [synthetic construct]
PAVMECYEAAFICHYV